jgi:hypothetical protein
MQAQKSLLYMKSNETQHIVNTVAFVLRVISVLLRKKPHVRSQMTASGKVEFMQRSGEQLQQREQQREQRAC